MGKRAVKTIEKRTVSFILLFEIIGGLVMSIGSFLAFVLIADEVLEREIIEFDIAISKFVYSFRNPILTDIMEGITFLGGEFLVLLVVGISLVFLFNKHTRESLLFMFISFTGVVLNQVLKFILKIPRPDIDPIHSANFYSFPSGHAMNSFIVYSCLAYFVFHFTHKKGLSILVACLCIFLIVLIGFSRVYLGVHYPSDIIAGFIAGFWWFITAIVLNRTLTAYRMWRKMKMSINI